MISFPSHIQIETSLACNSRCVFCPHKEMRRGPRNMADAVWKKIVDESRGRGIVYRPFMINEPFVDLRMPGIVRYIKQDATARVEFNSNGNVPAACDLPALIGAGIDLIRFSLDGASPESFSKSGRGGDYHAIVANILRFVAERDRQQSSCAIEVRMIDLPENREEQPRFLEFWQTRADKATITELYDWPWSGQTGPFRAPCPKIRSEMFFMTDGRAVLCCWDAFARGVVGDVNERTVEQIWLGEENQRCRDLLSRGERDAITLCSRCDAYQKFDFTRWPGY